MWRTPASIGPGTDELALEANAARAGIALGCPYSGSEEFEAEVIAARRAAGAFNPPRYRRELLWAGALIVALALLIA